MSRTAAATPRRDDTLTPRYLSDRRGAPAGGRIRLSSGPTWLLHYAPCGVTTAERVHAPGEVPGGDAHSPPVRAIGVSVPGGTAMPAQRSIAGRMTVCHSSAVRLSG